MSSFTRQKKEKLENAFFFFVTRFADAPRENVLARNLSEHYLARTRVRVNTVGGLKRSRRARTIEERR